MFLFCVVGLPKGECRPFVVEGKQVGLIRPDILKQLYRYPALFHISEQDISEVCIYIKLIHCHSLNYLNNITPSGISSESL